MSHEPECPYNDDPSAWVRADGSCGYCFLARDAYQRGREDAAERVEALTGYHITEARRKGLLPLLYVIREQAIAAARGGER